MATIAELRTQLAATPEGLDRKRRAYAEDIDGLLKQAEAATVQLQSIVAQLTKVSAAAKLAGCSDGVMATADNAVMRINADLAQGIISREK